MRESQSMTGYSDEQIGFEGIRKGLVDGAFAEECQDNELMNDDDNECRDNLHVYDGGCR
jgi:hypothetical protein